MTRYSDLMPCEPGALVKRLCHELGQVRDARGGFPFFTPFRRECGEFPWAPEVESAERDHHGFVTLDLPGPTTEEGGTS